MGSTCDGCMKYSSALPSWTDFRGPPPFVTSPEERRIMSFKHFKGFKTTADIGNTYKIGDVLG